jgi:hypothetical protein
MDPATMSVPKVWASVEDLDAWQFGVTPPTGLRAATRDCVRLAP